MSPEYISQLNIFAMNPYKGGKVWSNPLIGFVLESPQWKLASVSKESSTMHFKSLLVNLWWIPFLVPSKQDELCGIFNTRTIYLQLGENGSINHRNQTWNNKNLSRCSMELVTCPSCSIQISIVHMDLPQLCIESSYVNASSEQCPCSALTVWEPSGHSPPAHLCLLTNTSVFTSSTRSVGVSFDLAPQNWTGSFVITFISQRNQNFVSGKIGQEGELTSPDFPSLYPRDFGVEHVISCAQEDCIIFLIFIDFLISPSSIMEFYNSDGKPIQLVSGLIARPKPVISSGPSLIIRFFGNGGTSMGYKALYYFVNRHTWLSSVNTDCGGEVDNLGGTIYMTGIQGYYDCIWIIQPAAAISHFKTHIYLKVVEYTEGELLVQHGLTSESRIIERFSDDHHQAVEHVTPISKGFYVSFRGTLSSEGKLVIAYSAFAYMDCLSGVDLLCGNKRCISVQLMCDSFDNCGDNSDEAGDCKPDDVDKSTGRYWWPIRGSDGGSGQGPSGALLSLGAALAGSALLLAAGVCRMVLRVRAPPSSNATHHMDHARTIAHLLNIAELDERDEPPTYEPPPEYNQVVKPAHQRRKHSTQRLIDQDSSSQLQYGEESTPSNSLAAEMKKQFVNLPAEKIPEILSNATLRVPDYSPPVSPIPTGHNALVIIPENAPKSLEPTSYNAIVRIPDNSPPVSLETTGYNEQELGLSLTLSTSPYKGGNKDSNLIWFASTPYKPASASNISAASFDTLYSNSCQDLTIPPPRLIKSQSQDNILWLRSEFAKNAMQEPLTSNFSSYAGDPVMSIEADKDYKRSSHSQRSLDDNFFEYSLPSSGFRNEPSCSTTENANG